ncbi:MBL fold metallo-hydrolase, partial [Paenibacillus sepulcri]|nr:MBL fold metallo-hydrolase [Paenibacillus sepulcri]
MKVQQLSEHIWSLKTWMIIPIHVWVVVEEDGVILVDAGLGSMTKGILSFIEKLGAGPLKAIVLTHGHSDHVGAIKKIRQHSSVPVYAHSIEIPYMEGKLPYPGRKKAAASVEAGLAKPLQADAD